MPEIAIGEGQNGSSLTVSVGDDIRLDLTENPTTGFRWHPVGIDGTVLQLRADDFAPGAAIGGGGGRRLRWAALRPGVTEVRLELKRAWEASAPRSVFTIHLSVT